MKQTTENTKRIVIIRKQIYLLVSTVYRVVNTNNTQQDIVWVYGIEFGPSIPLVQSQGQALSLFSPFP